MILVRNEKSLEGFEIFWPMIREEKNNKRMLKKEKRKDLRRKRVKDSIYSNGLNKKWRKI